MIAQCWLHIGTEKTGTTTIQNFMARNRNALLSQGYLYPVAPGTDNHRGLTAFGLDDRKIDNVRIACGITNTEQVQPYRQKLRAALDEEIRASTATKIVFSNEHLSSRLVGRLELLRIKEICDQVAPLTKVVVYLRNQVDFLASWYGTFVESGTTREFPYPLGKHMTRQLDYAALLASWRDVFGLQNMIVRRYEREDFPGGDVLEDFATQIGADIADFQRVEQLNESLDATSIAFLREFNRYVPRFQDNGLNPLRGRVTGILQKNKQGERLAIPHKIAEEIEEKFRASNESVSSEYFSSRFNPLFSPSHYTTRKNSELNDKIDVAEAVRISTLLWCAQQARIRRLEKQVK